MRMFKILIVEDDKDLNRLISSYMCNSGYTVTSCFNGEEALNEFERGKFNLILTDVMMPKLDGFELAENVRYSDKNIPIIFMTARDDKPSKMLGFKIGIDDYVVKPFDLDVLQLKIAAVLRRAKIETDKKITVGNFSMDVEERVALVDGKEISLTVREFDLLFKMLSFPKKTFTRSALMEEFWDYDSSATSRTVDVYMAKLREKTANCTSFEILTVHGLGYKAVLK